MRLVGNTATAKRTAPEILPRSDQGQLRIALVGVGYLCLSLDVPRSADKEIRCCLYWGYDENGKNDLRRAHGREGMTSRGQAKFSADDLRIGRFCHNQLTVSGSSAINV